MIYSPHIKSFISNTNLIYLSMICINIDKSGKKKIMYIFFLSWLDK